MPLDLSLPAPLAPERPKTLSRHGERRSDPYYWLRERDDPATLAYLQAENDYANAALAPLAPLAESLYHEMLGRIEETDQSVPWRLGAWLYYSRTEAGRQYPLLCRRPAAGGAETVLLDLNAMARGKAFFSVEHFEPSPDGRLLAFSIDSRGDRRYQLRVKDLDSGKLLPLRRNRITSVAWALDNRTLFFTSEDPTTKRSDQLWRHRLGDETDCLLRQETDERFELEVHLSRSQRYLFVDSNSLTSSETRFLPADRPNGRWRLLARRRAEVEYEVDHHGEHFYLRINDQGRNFRLVAVPIANPAREHWQEVVPHRPDVVLEGFDCFRDYRVLYEREAGLPHFTITELASGDSHRIEIELESYSAYGDVNPEWNTRQFRFGIESLTRPDTLYEYDMASRERQVLKTRPVKGDFDPSRYVCRRMEVRAADGTAIPVSLAYRHDALAHGPAPLWLDGYGAYGIANDVYFASTRLSLLDRGVIYAVAHIRGGGDLGPSWHDAGKMAAKINSFTDFIAVAQALVDSGHTAPDRLLIEGGSAGGLLVAGVGNMRPDLFAVVLCEVPFVDVLTTMQDPLLPLTVGEYEEWGNPRLAEQYGWMRAYSPYDNIKAQDYPAMLVRAGLHDSQVMYWEAAKYVARLRRLKTDQQPLLLLTEMEAGHGGRSGRYDRLHDTALDYAFALTQLGVER
ncbi:S9 family peptidase [Chitinimonas lacunae]|uniref:S9 family peptidase n=1 Tax=Chitinimonas lacunae TaxID=1963018 RepID=A0ABV8MLG6_9NEIS